MEKKEVFIAKPTKQQLTWQDLELGVIIHYLAEIYRPDLEGEWYKTKLVREALAPKTIHPKRLDPEQWVRCADEMGAKYAVLVANHATGFSLWDTKVNDFSIAHTDWRGGGGDIVAEFVAACGKYGLRPGLYYCTGVNGYYGIDDRDEQDHHAEYYREYVKAVEAQLEELWSKYGEMTEIWFDGGVIPPENGGPDVVPLLKRYQPNAVIFQGPNEWPHNIRWVGNEEGLAPENCWATTNAGNAHFDGTISNEKAGIGDPDGVHYRPAETDMPNRKHMAFGGGWGWAKDEGKYCYSPEELLDCYLRSVGRNSNLLLGMAISADGEFEDEDQFRAFGELLKSEFSSPVAALECPEAEDGIFSVELPEEKRLKYIAIREEISEGQRIRGFRILADGKTIYESECVGHKRIVPLGGIEAKAITLEITIAAGEAKIRDITLF